MSSFYKEKTQTMVEHILNLDIAQFKGVGAYDIPELAPVKELPRIDKWVGFNECMSDTAPTYHAVHFFLDDYQFERVWNNPLRYIKILSRYACVATPDFSMYGDMPLITQAFNMYRKNWLGRLMQEYGITVIPTVRCSTDERSLDFFTDGIPHGSIIMMSAMWSKKYPEEAKKEYQIIKKKLHPSKILMYGKKKHTSIYCDDNVEFIKNFTESREEKKWQAIKASNT